MKTKVIDSLPSKIPNTVFYWLLSQLNWPMGIEEVSCKKVFGNSTML